MSVTYSGELSKFARSKNQVVKIEADFCDESFGVAPCTATGTKCYNTFYTCGDTANFNKTTKTYLFSRNDKYIVSGAYPFIKSVNDISSEIKQKNTVVKRLKVTMLDQPDDDIMIDPYVSTRASVQGTFWRKWLARNPNYKGRLITLLEGFQGMSLANYETKFVGRLENIKIDGYSVEIEAVDLLKSLGDLKYPIITSASLTSAVGKYWGEVVSQANMESIQADIDDYCKRTDLTAITNFTVTSAYDASGTHTTNQVYYVVALDAELRVVARSSEIGQTLGGGDNAFSLSWDAVTGFGSVIYYVYRYNTSTLSYDYYANIYTTSYTDINGTVTDSDVWVPTKAEKYYKKTDGSPDGWTWQTDNELQISVGSTADFESSGYIQIDDEIIYYPTKASTYFSSRFGYRGQFGTEHERHEASTNVKSIFIKSSTNPFTLLKSFLTAAGVSSSYISSKFDTYVSSWAGPNVQLGIVSKEVKLSDLFFMLVNDLNCAVWVNESGSVDIVKLDEEPGSFTAITDDDIIKGSVKIDQNEESRYTRNVLFWNRFDTEKGLKEREAYSFVNVEVDATSESANGYNESVEDVQYSPFLSNDLSGTSTWVSTLLATRNDRVKQAQTWITFSVEMRSEDIALGEIIKLSTDELQDVDGENWSEVKCRVVRKTPDGNRVELKVERFFS